MLRKITLPTSPHFLRDFKALNEAQQMLYFGYLMGINLMVTGGGGVGKSHFIRFLRRYHPTVAITASTGIAGVNIEGQTLDSYMGFSRTTHTIEQAERIKEPHIRKRLGETETLLIDEGSTLRIDKFEMTEARLRKAKKDKRLFGGTQIIVVADFMQLTPVLKKNSPEGQAFLRNYQDRIFLFESDIYKNAEFHPYLLHQYIRNGNETERRILRNMRMGNELHKVVDLLNFYANGSTYYPAAITICKTNARADQLNQEALDRNPNPAKQYLAVISEDYPNTSPVEQTITLKLGCRVMMLLNNPDAGYMNGDVGDVVELLKESIRVKLDRGDTILIERFEWEHAEIDELSGEPVKNKAPETFSQLPLRLGHAITAHKCQGLTLDAAFADLSGDFNADGMMYVICSRVVRLSGLKFSRPLRLKDIRVNKKAAEFTLRISKESLALEASRRLSMQLHLNSLGVNIETSH